MRIIPRGMMRVTTMLSDATRVDEWLIEAEIKSVTLAHPPHKQKAVGDAYEFYEQEVRLAKLLGTAVADAAGKALEVYDEITGLNGAIVSLKASPFNLAKQLERLTPILQKSWNATTEKTVASYISVITGIGAKRAGGWERFKKMQSRPLIEAGMVASSKYYTNNYFNRIVLPAMVGDINRKMEKGEPFDDTFYRALREKMDTRLKSVPYWRLVGNQAASRAYHYGLTRAGLASGYTGYQFVAVLDERTTQVCRTLNGKTFWLADAVQRLEKLAKTDPAEMPNAAPWAVPSDVEGKDSDQLTKDGFSMPPLHSGCRSTISLLR